MKRLMQVMLAMVLVLVTATTFCVNTASAQVASKPSAVSETSPLSARGGLLRLQWFGSGGNIFLDVENSGVIPRTPVIGFAYNQSLSNQRWNLNNAGPSTEDFVTSSIAISGSSDSLYLSVDQNCNPRHGDAGAPNATCQLITERVPRTARPSANALWRFENGRLINNQRPQAVIVAYRRINSTIINDLYLELPQRSVTVTPSLVN